MKRKVVITLFLASAALMCACAKERPNSEQVDSPVISESMLSDYSSDALDNTFSNQDEEQNVTDPGTLSEDEIAYFNDFIQSYENYGFLLSNYKDVVYSDKGSIFSQGAGINHDLSEEERAYYLNFLGFDSNDETLRDPIVISYQDIEDFLHKKDIEYILNCEGFDREFVYDENTQCFVKVNSGETNYEKYVVLEGKRNKDQVILKVTQEISNKYRDSYPSGYAYPDKYIELREIDDDYTFVSCEEILYDNIVDNHVYEFVHPYLGPVRFIVNKPIHEDCDYTVSLLSLMKEKTDAYETRSILHSGDALLNGLKFDSISDISIKDFDSDGIIDIAIISKYIDENGNDSYIARAFTSDNDYELYPLDNSLSEKITNNHSVINGETKLDDFLNDNIDGSNNLEWKAIFAEYFGNQDESINGYENYSVIFLDNNDVPEIVNPSYGMPQSVFYTIDSNKEINTLETTRGAFDYSPYSGLVLNDESHQGTLWTNIYKLNDGQFTTLFEGTGEYDIFEEREDGTYPTTYYINDQEVSEDTYLEKVKSFYNESNSIKSSSLFSLRKEDLLRFLNSEVKKVFE